MSVPAPPADDPPSGPDTNAPTQPADDPTPAPALDDVTDTVGDAVSELTGPPRRRASDGSATPPPSAPSSDAPTAILDGVSGALDQAGQAIDTPNTDVPELGTAPTEPTNPTPSAPLSPLTDTLRLDRRQPARAGHRSARAAGLG